MRRFGQPDQPSSPPLFQACRPADFYRVYFAVYTDVPDDSWVNPLRSTLRSFDVPPVAKRWPSDSLWVGYHSVPRDCFDFPF